MKHKITLFETRPINCGISIDIEMTMYLDSAFWPTVKDAEEYARLHWLHLGMPGAWDKSKCLAETVE
jgi:hypothetical protein